MLKQHEILQKKGVTSSNHAK